MSILEGWPTGKAADCYAVDGVTPEHVRFVHPPLETLCPCSSMEEQRSTKPWSCRFESCQGYAFGEATRWATGAVLKTVWAKAVRVRLPLSPLDVWHREVRRPQSCCS